VINVEKTASIESLKTLAGEALKLPDISPYSFALVGHLCDIIALGGAGQASDLKDDSTLLQAEVTSQATLFLTPNTGKRTKSRKPKVEEELTTTDSLDEAFEATLDEENIASKLASAKGVRAATCLAWIDKHAKGVFESKALLAFSKETLASILKRDTLQAIKEVELFEALLRWGKAKESKDTPGAFKETIKDLLPFIRFPTMKTVDVASKVAPSDVLPSSRILALFTYLAKGGGEKKEGIVPVLPVDLATFSGVPRKSTAKYLVRFDRTTARVIDVSPDGKTATRPSGYDSLVLGETPLESDSLIEVGLVAESSWSGSFIFGIIPRSSALPTTCFTSSAWYLDIWHGSMRSLESTLEVQSLKGTELQRLFNESCEGRIMGMRFVAGAKGGGKIEWFLDRKPIEGAVLTIAESYTEKNLVPFFGVYGRCRGVRALD